MWIRPYLHPFCEWCGALECWRKWIGRVSVNLQTTLMLYLTYRKCTYASWNIYILSFTWRAHTYTPSSITDILVYSLLLLLLLLLPVYFVLQLFEYQKWKHFLWLGLCFITPDWSYIRRKRTLLPITKCWAHTHIITCLQDQEAHAICLSSNVKSFACFLPFLIAPVAVVRPQRYSNHKSAFHGKSEPSQVSIYFCIARKTVTHFRSPTQNQYR